MTDNKKEELKKRIIEQIGQISVADFSASNKNWQIYNNVTGKMVDFIVKEIEEAEIKSFEYLVVFQQNGDEYVGSFTVKCNELIQLDELTINVDGVTIILDEKIVEITKSNLENK